MRRKRRSRSKPTIFDYYNDESTGTTEFRRLVRNIKHSTNPAGIGSILITSSTKHEGKSLIASNLAITIAKRESDKEVLLVDCDLRRPVIHSLFGIRSDPGFATLLAGKLEPRDVAQDTELSNLKVIPCGRSSDSVSYLLGSTKEALDNCKKHFDILICDAPPIVPVDDVGILGQNVEGILMVVLAGKTDRMVVKRAMELLDEINANVLGIVLNNLHSALPYYYDYSYYHYKYKEKKTQEENTS